MRLKLHTPPSDRRWLTVAEAAQIAEVSRNTMRKWISEGLVQCVMRPDGLRLVLRESLVQPVFGRPMTWVIAKAGHGWICRGICSVPLLRHMLQDARTVAAFREREDAMRCVARLRGR